MLFALSLCTTLTWAEEPETSAGSQRDIDFSEARTIDDVKGSELKWLKPKRHWLPQNPYAHTDFSAYTLETGEVEVGLVNIRAGLLPNVQIGTAPLLNVAGIFNGQLKVRALRVGRVDVSGQINHLRHNGGLEGRYTTGKLTTSVRVLEPWSLHISGSYLTANLNGLPEVDGAIPTLIGQYTGYDLESWRAEAVEQGLALNMEGDAITIGLASDVRFNRRDSLIIQAQAAIWGRANASAQAESLDLPPVLGLPETLDFEEGGFVPPQQAYLTSVAWQWSWKRAYLRVGAGLSSVEGAWLVQSTELAWRFGGQTRQNERRIRAAWRNNKRQLKKGADAAQSAGQADNSAINNE